MFYGKECNYYYKCDDKTGYDVFFLLTKEDECVDFRTLSSNHYDDVDTCILWSAYHWIEEKGSNFTWYRIKVQNGANAELEMEFTTKDELIEAMWNTLEDVNIDEDECIEQNWFIFDIGTHREAIWHWFDRHHRKGVGWLINEFEADL